MITVVRLKERDTRKGFNMRVYISGTTRSKYTAGVGGQPSAFRVIKNRDEIAELSEFPQFEILDFESMEQLRQFVQQEMEDRARLGFPAVRAAIIGGDTGQRIKPRKSAHTRLPLPAAATGGVRSGVPSDPNRTNTGRKPKSVEPEPEAETETETEQEPAATKPVPKKRVPIVEGKTRKDLLLMAAKLGVEGITPKMKKAEIAAAIMRASR